MAKQGNKTSYTSRGTGRNVSRATRSAMKQARPKCEKEINAQKAWIKGSNPWVTIRNPNKNETDKLFIRVRMNTLKGGSYKDLIKKMSPA